jgi:hypothetical protein
MNEGKRLISVFISPSRCFEDIKDKSRWWLPFLILLVAAAIASVLPRLTIPPDVFLETIRQNLPQGVEMQEEQMQMIVERMSSPVAIIGTAVSVILLQTIITFLSALVFWVLFSLFGGKSSFKKSISIVSYTGLVTALGLLFISALSIILQRVDIMTSLGLLPFLDRGTFLFRFASQIDFFALWRVLLMGFGFAIVTESPRWKGLTLVIVPWLLLSLGVAAINVGFGR